MKFKIQEKAINIVTGKKCIIVGTKEKAYQPTNMISNQEEIMPDKGYDYLIMSKNENINNQREYSGLTSVVEGHLNKI